MLPFEQLPLVAEGESKEVRYAGNGEVLIRLKPTIYSYTYNRAGILEGSDRLRLRAIRALLPVLERAGIKHTYRNVGNCLISSQLVLQPHVEGESAPFVPDDLSTEQIAALPKAPPIEVVVKRRHSGTPKHRYYNFSRYPTRDGQYIQADETYPERFVRFDWRNPMIDTGGQRLADEVLPESMADWFINVPEAKRTALTAFDTLLTHLGKLGLELWDICFFVTEDGKQLFGEISPDCLRVRAADSTSLDKDVWRSGGSSEQVLQKWEQFNELIGG